MILLNISSLTHSFANITTIKSTGLWLISTTNAICSHFHMMRLFTERQLLLIRCGAYMARNSLRLVHSILICLLTLAKSLILWAMKLHNSVNGTKPKSLTGSCLNIHHTKDLQDFSMIYQQLWKLTLLSTSTIMIAAVSYGLMLMITTIIFTPI